MNRSSPTDILAACSAGGHLDQMMLLHDAFAGQKTVFAATQPDQAAHYGIMDCVRLVDANQNTPLALVSSFLQARRIVKRYKPRIVISTGAAPGLFCLMHGKSIGAYTIWIDSVANGSKISLSGRIATRFCDEVLTQHENLATQRVAYQGRVI